MNALLFIAGVSGAASIVLFFFVVLSSRRIGDGSVPEATGFLEVVLSCVWSIVAGLFRGEFKGPVERGFLVAFLISVSVFAGSLYMLLR